MRRMTPGFKSRFGPGYRGTSGTERQGSRRAHRGAKFGSGRLALAEVCREHEARFERDPCWRLSRCNSGGMTMSPNQPTTAPTSIYRYRAGLYAADLLTAALAHLDFFTGLTRTRPTLIQSADLSDYKNGQRT